MAKASSDAYVARALEVYGNLPNARAEDQLVMVTGVGDHNLGSAIVACMRSRGVRVEGFAHKELDIRDQVQIDAVLAHGAGREWTALINCAGDMDLSWFQDFRMERVGEIVGTNLLGAYRLSASFVRATMCVPWRKHIVHIGSMAARKPLNGSAPYCMSKAGLEMMVRCLAFELAPFGYDALCVHPSMIEGTPMTSKTIAKVAELRGLSPEDAEEYARTGMLRGRWLLPAEIAEQVLLFVLGKCNYLSGSAICLDGGNR